MTIIGAIDVGSNAMRLAIGKFSAAGILKSVQGFREPVRLGREVFRSGVISPALMEEAIAALLRFQKLLKSQKISAIHAVGTSALRDASNASDFLERVRRVTGIPLEVISGEEEARLIHTAVSNVVDLKRGVTLLVDIGGGSVEVTLIDRGKIVLSDSLQMGTVRLLELMRGRASGLRLIERLVREHARRIRRQVERHIGRRTVTRVVGTGGNIETFGVLRKQILGQRDSSIVFLPELVKIYDRLARYSVAKRVELFKLKPDRADVIIPAGALLKAIIRESGAKKLLIPGVGLREGVLIDTFEGLDDSTDAAPLRRRMKGLLLATYDLANNHKADLPHAKQVAKLSTMLFDKTKSLHRLDDEARSFLELAAIVHDVGHFINSTDHHKHSGYIIRNSSLIGLSEEQRGIVAAIARYHRGSNPSVEHAEWGGLDIYHRRLVMVCGGILRLCEELDREHLKRVSKVNVRRVRDVLRISLVGRGRLLIEKWGATERRDLLELALGCEVVIA